MGKYQRKKRTASRGNPSVKNDVDYRRDRPSAYYQGCLNTCNKNPSLFIDNEDYFTKRLMAKDENGVEYDDNGERAIFFARGVLETVKKLRWTPDVIHCQGWMCSAIPLYVKTAYREEPSFANTKL